MRSKQFGGVCRITHEEGRGSGDRSQIRLPCKLSPKKAGQGSSVGEHWCVKPEVGGSSPPLPEAILGGSRMSMGQMSIELIAANAFNLTLSNGVTMHLHEGIDGTLTVEPVRARVDTPQTIFVEVQGTPGTWISKGYASQVRLTPEGG